MEKEKNHMISIICGIKNRKQQVIERTQIQTTILWLLEEQEVKYTVMGPSRVVQLVVVSSSTPDGCRFHSRSGHILWLWSDSCLEPYGRQPINVFSHVNVFFFSLSLFLSLSVKIKKSMNRSSGEEYIHVLHLSIYRCITELHT